jgi:arginyl-tRNA synthetase
MELIMLLKQKLQNIVAQAALEAMKKGSIADVPLPEVMVERPQNGKFGDYASSLPLKISRSVGLKPLIIANIINEFIPTNIPEIEKVSITAPGFINFTMRRSWLSEQVNEILAGGKTWGNINLGENKSVQIEFVSVNPTGPLHVGHGRGAVLGSVLTNVLQSAGYKVQKEYYINDAGNQLDNFKKSLHVRYQQSLGVDVNMPEDGYMGKYVNELVAEIRSSNDAKLKTLSENDLVEQLGSIGSDLIMGKIKEDLNLLGVSFDLWFSEKSLRDSGLYNKVINMLESQNYTANREKAIWFASSLLGEDKDNVLIRSDGTPTYFAYDIAYHYDKFVNRNFDTVIDVWGADHQGHVSRMKAAIGSLGINPERLKIIICQLVTLKRGEEVVRVSKRSGDLITLREVIDEVGQDACRFVFLSRSANSQMDFDLELAKKQSDDNPIFYVQYAYARICSILRLAKEKNIQYNSGDVSILEDEAELELIRNMVKLPEILEMSAMYLEPHHLAYYAQQLATVFHFFYKQCRVISDDLEKTKARLKLVESSKLVLEKVLDLMGISAPETM